MNKNINLCEILKGHEGETFYCSLFGEDVKISWVYPNTICFKLNNNVPIELHHNGGFSPNGECQLFPSKDQRDWSKWLEEQKPKVPKTWNELIHNRAKYLFDSDNYRDYCVDITGHNCLGYTRRNTPIEKSALAFLKIHQLIEVGYGGNATKEEWSTLRNIYQIEYDVYTHSIIITNSAPMRFFSPIAFHTKEQAEEFLSKPENVQLLEDYFMI